MAAYRSLMKWAKYRHDELQALSGVAIAVFVFVLAFCTYRLWRHGVQLARMQALDTDAALAAARQASEAAMRSADAARAVLVDGQRPWVQVLAVETGADLLVDGTGTSVQVEVRVKNVGRAPALQVGVRVEVRREASLGAAVTEPDNPPAGLTLFPEQGATLSSRVMLPQVPADTASRAPATGAAAGTVDDGLPPLFLAGAVFYSLSLDGSRRRTEFCFAFRRNAASSPDREGDPARASTAGFAAAPDRSVAAPAGIGPRMAT